MHDRIEVRSHEESSSMVSAGTADLYSTMPGSTQNRSKTPFGSRKIGPKTTKKRENSVVGRSGALEDAPRTPGEASKSAPGRVWDGPRALPGQPGRPQVGPRSPRGASGEPPRAIRTTPGRGPRAFGRQKRVRTASASKFRRFLVRSKEGRTSIFVSQCSVLLTSDEERTERQHAAKK